MTEQKTTYTMWLIALFYLLGAAYAAITYLLVAGRGTPNIFEAENLHLLLSGFTMLCHLGGALMLLRLRKLAFSFFAVGFVMSVITFAYHVFESGWLSDAQGGALLGSIIGVGVNILVLLYVRKMGRLKVLT